MQSTVKDTYIEAQSRMMYTAYIFYSVLCVGLMAAELYLNGNPNETISLILTVMSIVTAVLFSLLAMLIVEVMYQDELSQMPLIASLGRLTPELNLVQRYIFLSVSVKRQIVSTISLISFWIAFGGTPRGASLIIGMAMITVLTVYGMSHLKTTARQTNADESKPDEPGDMTMRIMS